MNLKGLRRDARSVLVATASTIIAGPNLNRYALILSCPMPVNQSEIPDGIVGNDIDVSTLGVKLSYIVPTESVGRLDLVALFNTAGPASQVVVLEILRAGVTISILSLTALTTYRGPIPLQGGDTVILRVSTAAALGTSDMLIGVTLFNTPSCVTVALQGPAVFNEGINLYPGNPPLVLCYDQLGTALHEDVFAIAAPSARIGVVDVFWP